MVLENWRNHVIYSMTSSISLPANSMQLVCATCICHIPAVCETCIEARFPSYIAFGKLRVRLPLITWCYLREQRTNPTEILNLNVRCMTGPFQSDLSYLQNFSMGVSSYLIS